MFPFAGGSSPFMFPLAIGGLLVVLAFVVSRVRYLGRVLREHRDQRSPLPASMTRRRLMAERVLYTGIAVVLIAVTGALFWGTCIADSG